MAGGIGRNLRDRQVVPLVVPKIADSVGSALRLGERSETGVVLPGWPVDLPRAVRGEYTRER